MCGIAGFHRRDDGAVPAHILLARMTDAIRHRGPDAQGVFADETVGLGHARLSIIDVAHGKQPMANDDGSIWLSFNGEIFNYVELRAELIARGHVFRTESDTEVIIRTYEAYGPDCVQSFNGDFAFALWDSRRKLFMLARDRMGVRPLYYSLRGRTLYFASEVKALLAVPGITATLDPIALDQILTFWFPLAPRTAFKDILELPPAHVLLATPEQTTVRPYWRLNYPRLGETPPVADEKAVADEVRALLLDATRIRLRSDVPVGAYLSGGFDSSLVSAAAKQFVAGRLRTFSVAFEAQEFDESSFQNEMVRALGTQHDRVVCMSDDIARVFPDVIRHTERPILRTAPAPLFILSELVQRRGFKVVLTGEGADEVFAGYDIFKEDKIRRFCARQPGSRLRPMLLRRLYPYLPRLQGQSQSYLAAFFGAGHDDVSDPLFSHLPRFRSTGGVKAFLSQDMQRELRGYDALAELRASLPQDFVHWRPLSQAQYLETAYLLPGYILSSQGDRVSMAHAVEGRFPFLDHRLVEFAATIPPRLKMRGLREKHILRESARGLLPDTIGERTKQPYRAPDAQCFTGPHAPDYLETCLSAASVADAGYFEPRAVQKLLAKCRKQDSPGYRDGMGLVGIISTQLWHREFVNRASSMQTHESPLSVPA